MFCANCNADAKSSCSKCARTAYCSRECQVKHWPKHRTWCSETSAQAIFIKFAYQKIRTSVVRFAALHPGPVTIEVNETIADFCNKGFHFIHVCCADSAAFPTIHPPIVFKFNDATKLVDVNGEFSSSANFTNSTQSTLSKFDKKDIESLVLEL